MSILFNSLRTQLIVTSLLVGAAMQAVFIAFQIDRIGADLDAQLHLRERTLRPLLNAALAAPLAQRDYAEVNQILREARQAEGLAYLIALDEAGHAIAAQGRPAAPLPTPDPEGTGGDADRLLDLRMLIDIGGQPVGELYYGISTDFIEVARRRLIHNALALGAVSLGILGLVMGILSWLLTRSFDRLAQGARRLGEGELGLRVMESGQDEVVALARTLNRMAGNLERRITDLARSKQRFHAIADYTHDLELWLAPSGALVWINPSVQRILGCSVEEAMETPLFPLPFVAPEDRAPTQQQIIDTLKGTSGSNFEFRMVPRGREPFWASANWQPLYDSDHRYQGIRASIRDISQSKAVSDRLRAALSEVRQANEQAFRNAQDAEQEHARLAALLSAMNLGILMVSDHNRTLYYNPAFLRIWGIPESPDLIGLAAQDLIARSANASAHPDRNGRQGGLESSDDSLACEVQLADGRLVTQAVYSVCDKSGRFIGRLWVHQDVTHERRTAERLAYLAERDSLTGLFNRFRFQQELARLIADCDRQKVQGALLFFDLDEFKVINDSFGHRAGDTLLIRVAGQVSALIRKNEFLARLGGDEFALIVPNASEADVVQIAERVVRAVAGIPFNFEGQSLHLTTSLGIACYPTHAADADDLVAHADAAMYRAKEAGKNTWRLWSDGPCSARALMDRLTWNERIDHALERGYLRLHFQGIYRCGDQRLSHLEALVRMVDEQDPGLIIMPGLFIPVAEKGGKIRAIDRWVIDTTIRTLATHPAMPPVAVNISGRSFDDPSLPEFIAGCLAEHRVEPQRLLVELTETSAVSDLADAQRFIEALRRAGCGICLDDFGSGFSSFAYLKHLPVDTVKIDGLFIRDLPRDPDNQVFVRAIADVARGLGKTTVAEFVEDERTLVMLRAYGVDLVQGYHLDRPQAEHPAVTSNWDGDRTPRAPAPPQPLAAVSCTPAAAPLQSQPPRD